MREWIELVRSLGAALLEVYRAEAAELGSEVQASSKHLAWAVGLFLAAGVVGFWTVATAIYFLIQVLALWLPPWGAAGVGLLALVLVVGALGALGYRRLRNWESPTESIRRRLADHRLWLDEHLLAAGDGEPAAGTDGARADGARETTTGTEESPT